PDQMSFSLARSWRAFVLAKEDRRGANKNEITIFVFSITAKDFSHGVLLDGKGDPLRVASLTRALGVNSVFGNWSGSPKAEVFAVEAGRYQRVPTGTGKAPSRWERTTALPAFKPASIPFSSPSPPPP